MQKQYCSRVCYLLVYTKNGLLLPGACILGPQEGLKILKGGLKVALGQKVQDSFFIASFAIINIPFYYPKLLHPLPSMDKMSIFKTFTVTCFICLQVQEVGFMSSTNDFISQRYFKHTNEPIYFPFIVTFTTIVFFKPKKYQIRLYY